ncbi:MAG: LptF/LptG family permease, partial [Chlamydiae bacterium]|nr:LptF/LptG family permease [Chlamydiota bacterium]
YLGALCCIFNWVSSEMLLPKALTSLNRFDDISHYNGRDRKEPFHILHLKDQSKLIYQTHDMESNTFCDVYWVKSFNEIWRIKTLKADPKNPIAELADHLVRSKDGTLTKVESYEKCIINGLTWQKDLNRKGIIPIESRKVSELYKVLAHKNEISKEQASEVLTTLCYKLVMPLLSLLAVVAIAPFCIRYTRSVPTFYIYASGLFGFITFFLLIDSLVILGSHNTLNPLVAILLPFGMCAGVFSWKFTKTI